MGGVRGWAKHRTPRREGVPRRRRQRIARARHRGLSIWDHSDQAARALRFGWSWAAAYCCIWSGADVLSRRSDPGAPVRGALRYAQVLRRAAGAGAPRAALRSAGWLAVCLHQPACHADARSVFRPLRILHLDEAARGRKIRPGLEAGPHARDGLDGFEADVGRDRAWEVAQALSTRAGEKGKNKHGAF